jgi:hypothetical protein
VSAVLVASRSSGSSCWCGIGGLEGSGRSRYSIWRDVAAGDSAGAESQRPVVASHEECCFGAVGVACLRQRDGVGRRPACPEFRPLLLRIRTTRTAASGLPRSTPPALLISRDCLRPQTGLEPWVELLERAREHETSASVRSKRHERAWRRTLGAGVRRRSTPSNRRSPMPFEARRRPGAGMSCRSSPPSSRRAGRRGRHPR